MTNVLRIWRLFFDAGCWSKLRDLTHQLRSCYAPPRFSVLLRIALALLAVGLAVNYLYDRLAINVSLDGVVSAPLTPIRSPIEGEVNIAHEAKPGQLIAPGSVLFTLTDTYRDGRALVDLRARLDDVESKLNASNEKINALKQQQSALNARAQQYREASELRLEASVAEITATLVGARASVHLASIEHTRASELARRNSIAVARVDSALANKERAFAEVQRLSALQRKHQIELQASRKGIILGEGYSDVPYSVQRIDELNLRLADLAVEKQLLENEQRGLKTRIAAEADRLALMTTSRVVSTTSGQLWKLKVSEGAWVSRGEALADFADCERSFVEATIPESGFALIRPGDLVQVRLSGESAATAGTVRSVRGVGSLISEDHRGAAVSRSAGGLVSVVIDLNPGSGSSICQVGRTARVYFTGGRRSTLMGWLSRVFT